MVPPAFGGQPNSSRTFLRKRNHQGWMAVAQSPQPLLRSSKTSGTASPTGAIRPLRLLDPRERVSPRSLPQFAEYKRSPRSDLPPDVGSRRRRTLSDTLVD